MINVTILILVIYFNLNELKSRLIGEAPYLICDRLVITLPRGVLSPLEQVSWTHGKVGVLHALFCHVTKGHVVTIEASESEYTPLWLLLVC